MRLALAVVLVIGGCGFQRQADFDLSLDRDGGDGGGAAGDGAPAQDLAGLDLAGSDNCPHPSLLVGLENVSGSNGGGKVLRFTIGAGALQPCSTLTGGGTLPAQPLAVAFIPPDTVAAATRDGLYLLGVDDLVRWNRPIPDISYLPVEVIPLKTPQGDTVPAVGYWHAGTSNPEIDHVDVQRDSGPPAYTFPQSGGVLSITQSPIDPGRWFALDDSAAADDVDPFSGAKSPYRAPAGGTTSFQTVSASSMSGYNRVVWVDAAANAVDYVRENNGNPILLGPIPCAAQTCNLIHAVPDPTDPTAFIALCEHAGTTTRDIVRWSSTGGACTAVYLGTQAGANTRLSRLAIAP